MAKRPLHLVRVIESRFLTRHMRRLTLKGESLRDITTADEGGYMKLLLPKDEVKKCPSEIPSNPQLSEYHKRSYTIRHVGDDEIVLDAVDHVIGGPGAAWFSDVAAGDMVLLAGPGPVARIAEECDWVLLAGDMTGLPAIAVNLAALDPDVVGVCLIEIYSGEDKQELLKPKGVRLEWIENSDLRASRLVSEVKRVAWHEGRVGVWAAAEYSAMKGLRAYFQEKNVPAADMYVSSYWKLGATDEEHKLAKKSESARS